MDTLNLASMTDTAEPKFDSTCEECGQEYFRKDEIFDGLCVPCGLWEENEQKARSSHLY